MTGKHQNETIRALLERHAVTREDTWRLADRFEAQARAAADVFFKRLLWVAVLWIVTFGVATGIITEAAISDFSMTRLSAILLAAPPLIALFFHDAISALLLENRLASSMEACLRHLYQGLTKDESLLLMPSATFIDAELTFDTLAAGGAKRLLRISTQVVFIALGLAPLLAIGHSAYLLLAAGAFPLGLSIGSIAIAALVVLRGLFILYAAFTSE